MRSPLPVVPLRARRLAAVSAIALLAAGLVAASATGASAASRPPAVSAASGLVASGSASQVTLTWKAAPSPRSNPVRGYRVALSPSAGSPRGGVTTTSASVHRVTYNHLTAGRTYTLSVTTLALHGSSRPVAARYAPKPTVAARQLFAIDSSGALVKLPASGGTATTVATGVSSYAVDAAGDAYAITPAGLVEITAAGSSKTLLASASDATDIELDARGDVFVVDGNAIVKVQAATAEATTVTTAPSHPVAFGVRPNGTVDLLVGGAGGPNVHSIVTVPAGGAASTRVIADSAYTYPILGDFDAEGDLYYKSISSGASGALTYDRVAAGATATTNVGGDYIVGGVGRSDAFFGLRAATGRTSIGLGTGQCVPDLKVASVTVTDAAGSTVRVPVTGLALSMDDTSPYGQTTGVTSDAAGSIYVSQTSGLTRYAVTGGAPTLVATGAYTDVQLTR